jgi:hypothetical protein
MGTSHQRLFCMKNENNSPAMPNLRAVVRMNFIIYLLRSDQQLVWSCVDMREIGLGRPIFLKSMGICRLLQAKLEAFRQKIDILVVEHGLVPPADSEDIHGAD